ncbi:UNVERIFIED_CONTAM: hypothetical protein Sradi_3648400 [Sesamum radiatum]|uniref:Reverse transcriptase n=1 Tax=Sesamum radiatum TaxID=300843 RepID=A0AAW2QJY9_SESRA
MHCIRRILGKLEVASSLKVNLEKSYVVFSKNAPVFGREALAEILGAHVEAKHDMYLGMPTVVGQSKREVFLNLKNRVWVRLQSWKCKNLSQEGKAVLIKSVIRRCQRL